MMSADNSPMLARLSGTGIEHVHDKERQTTNKTENGSQNNGSHFVTRDPFTFSFPFTFLN